MIKVEKTMLVGRYNLVNTLKEGDDRCIRQLSLSEVKTLANSIIDLIEV